MIPRISYSELDMIPRISYSELDMIPRISYSELDKILINFSNKFCPYFL